MIFVGFDFLKYAKEMIFSYLRGCLEIGPVSSTAGSCCVQKPCVCWDVWGKLGVVGLLQPDDPDTPTEFSPG